MRTLKTGLIAAMSAPSKFLTIFAFAAALAALAAPAQASTIVYQDQSGIMVNLQNWQGNLGMDFQVNSTIVVDALGVFDNGNIGTLVGSTGTGVEVGIFNLTTGLLVGPSLLFTPASLVTQTGGDAFLNVTPFSLVPGQYSIVTLNDQNYNEGFTNHTNNTTQTLNSLGGAISFIGSSRFDGNSGLLELPSEIDGGPANRYDAGTFAATPLPATWTMLLIGLAGLGFVGSVSRKGARVAA